MLLRRKSTTDDEYHHADTVGVYGVITGANGAVMSSSVYDVLMYREFLSGSVWTETIDNRVTRMLETGFLLIGFACYLPDRLIALNRKVGQKTLQKPMRGEIPVGPCPGGMLMACTLLNEFECDFVCIWGQEGCYRCYQGINAGVWCDCIEVHFF